MVVKRYLLPLYILLSVIILAGGYRSQIAVLDPRIEFPQQADSRLYVITLVLYLIGFMFFIKAFISDRGLISNIGTIFILPLVMMTTTIWSNFRAETFWAAAFYLSTVINCVASLYMWKLCGRQDFITYLLYMIISLSVFTVLMSPEIGVHQYTDAIQSSHAGEWRGIFGHRTSLGYVAALCSIVSIRNYLYGSKRLVHFVFFGLSALSVFMANSAGGIIVFLISLSLLIFVLPITKLEKNLRIVIVLCAITFFVVASTLFVLFYEEILELFGKDSTFTGRVPYWRIILNTTDLNMLFGGGYKSGFIHIVLPKLQSVFPFTTIPNTQGGFIEAYVAGGLIGIAALSYFLIYLIFGFIDKVRCVYKIELNSKQKNIAMQEAMLYCGVAVMATVNAIAEIDLFQPSNPILPLVIFGICNPPNLQGPADNTVR